MGVTTSTCIYTICIWPRMSRMLSLQPFTATDEEVVMLHTAFSVMKSCKGCLVAFEADVWRSVSVASRCTGGVSPH